MEPVSWRPGFAPPAMPLTRRLLVYFRSGAYSSQQLALFWDEKACPAKTAAGADVKQAVTASAASTGDLSNAVTAANNNFTSVQQAVIDALVKVLDDQSIKVDNIKDVINAASDEIAKNVTQSMQKAIQAEVARQLKEAAKK